jgi:thioredoxin 2
MTLDARGVITTCASCGRANRLAYATLSKEGRCAQCKTSLPPPATPLEATDSAVFDAAAQSSRLPLVVDFWAEWCGPCRMVAPELEKVARSNAGRLLVVKVNTEVLQDVAARYRIRSIPTLAVVQGGRELDRVAGARPAPEIEAFVTRTIAANERRAS